MDFLPEIASVGVLIAMFVIATVRGINMGILGFVAAFVVGGLIFGMTPDEYLAGFPVDLFVTLLGIMFLFGIAQHNGTIQIIVLAVMRLARGKILLAPWLFFLLTAGLEFVGVVFAVPIVTPFAMNFARRYGLNLLMTGLMLVHGAFAGAFSPMSVYGVFINGFLEDNGIQPQPLILFLAPFVVNTIFAAIVFAVLHRRRGIHDSGSDQGLTNIATALPPHPSAVNYATAIQVLTLAGIAVMVVGVVGFGIDVGVLALTIGAIIALIRPTDAGPAIATISWPILLLLSGVLTYIGVLKAGGTEAWAAENIAAIGIPSLVVLLLFYLAGVISALASSLGMIGVILALATPFLQEGSIAVGGFVAGLALAATIVDVSPFSPNGAMLLAGVESRVRDRFYRQILAYSGLMIVLGPAIGWLIALLPTWLPS